MANYPTANSSNSNHAHELGLGLCLGFDPHNDNFYARATHPLRRSTPTITKNGRVDQLQLNQMANELRRSYEIIGWSQGRVRISSSNPYEVGASSSHGNVRTNTQIVGASSSSSPSIIGTVTAKELMESQILYSDPSTWKHLRTKLNFKDKGYNHGIRAPSPGLGLDLHDRSWNQQTQVASNYNPNMPNQIISIHSSYRNHPSSQTCLTNSITHPHNLNARYNKTHCPSSFTVHEMNKNKNKHTATVSAPPHQINNMGIKINSNYDGCIRSLPHKKNGPYTCSHCNQEFPTSQHFANHVRAKHYKHESKAQRRKRLMSKLRPRNFCIGKVNGQITCFPVSSSKARDI